jgi:pimeloyl-ACP methyl ester carboxylesterase
VHEKPTHRLAAHSRRARVAGIDTHWLEAGTGEAVFLLHGLGASSYSWRDVLPALSARFRVIAPDWPGFGRSEAPLTHDYSLDGQSRWLCAFMDHLGVSSGRLAGNSMGGVISLVTAMDYPARVERFALLGAPTYLGEYPKLLWPMRWPVIGRVYESLLGPLAVRYVGRTAFKDQSLLTEEAISEYALSLKRPEGRRATGEFLRRAVPPDAHERMKRYPQLTQKILYICGDSDGVVKASSARRFCKEAPKARLLEIAACGHASQEEKPEIVAQALAEFFA